MIEEAVNNAREGVEISKEVSSALAEIETGAIKVNDLVSEIAAAANEQSSGIDQINIAVSQVDKVTQANAATSEESASAAEELNSQAVTLADMINTFKITNSSRSA